MKLALGAYEAAVRERASALAPEWERLWQRDAGFWGGGEARRASVANRLGWLSIASSMRAQVPQLLEFAADVRDAGFRDAVVLGMGGSSLAPEVLARSIADDEGAGRWPRLHVLDSTDPATVLALRRTIDLSHTLFFVSSKSGTTIEALSLCAYFDEAVRGVLGDEAGKSFVAITDSGTPLEALAAQRGFRRAFVNPADIGGRYSALSYFGLAPAAVAGVDVAKLLARGTEEEARSRDASCDALLLGATIGELARQGRNKCTLVLSPGIESLGLWVEQLLAESTGKEGTGVLPVHGEPAGSAGTYGGDRFFVRLKLEGDREDRAVTDELMAAAVPVVTLELRDVYDLGRQFFLWELAVAVAGRVLGINPFDEPNVQESKDNTSRVLSSGGGSAREPSKAETPAPFRGNGERVEGSLEGALAALLAGVRPPQYIAITAFMQETGDRSRSLGELRGALREATGAATTLGFGPRYLHSTGQLHKGGPPTGVFLQLVAAADEDAPIPGEPFTFGQLIAAQAAGDVQSLAGRGRPALRVDLGRDVRGGLDAVVAAAQRIAVRSRGER